MVEETTDYLETMDQRDYVIRYLLFISAHLYLYTTIIAGQIRNISVHENWRIKYAILSKCRQ